MVICILGTRAQLIKMAPVLRVMEQRRQPYKLLFTGQHKVTITDLIEEFGIAATPEYIYRGNEISGLFSMAWWLPLTLWRLWKQRTYWLGNQPESSIMLIHGDTFSTLIGALIGKLTGMRVAHVESGLRSYNLLHPFPEEITRLLCFRLSDIAFCPGDWAWDNMKKYRLERINTGANTLLDTVRYAVTCHSDKTPIMESPYCVISIHRFENIFFRKRLHQIVTIIERLGNEFQVVFVLHPATERRLTAAGLIKRLAANPGIRLLPRMTYIPFLQLIHGAHFVVTDGGSNQEELSYLNKPTLIMRSATERREGMDSHARLCKYDQATVEQFLSEIRPFPRCNTVLNDGPQPSEIIVSHLHSLEPGLS